MNGFVEQLHGEGKSSKMRDFHGFSSHDYQRLLGLRYVVHPKCSPLGHGNKYEFQVIFSGVIHDEKHKVPKEDPSIPNSIQNWYKL